ncbi:MAG: isochorismate synthase [Calditrichia bacterium]
MATLSTEVQYHIIESIYRTFLQDIAKKSLKKGVVYQASYKVDEHRIADWIKSCVSLAVPFFYWHNRGDTFEVIGIKPLEVISGSDVSHVQHAFDDHRQKIELDSPGIRYFGGMQFNGLHRARAAWKGWPGYFFMIPHLEIIREKSQFFININYTSQSLSDLNHLVSLLQQDIEIQEECDGTCLVNRSDVPGKREWTHLIHQALDEFSPNDMVKVVLARESRFNFSHSVPVIRLIEELHHHNSKSTYHFAFSPDGNEIFVGLTPERLYVRDKDVLQSEAIAGTRRRGETPEGDAELEKELMCSSKDRFEHKLVMDSIDNQFYFLCDEVTRQQDVSVLKLDHLQHLYCAFRGKLKPEITDPIIIAALHPTPAVGGSPRDKAMAFLSENEPFDRGWYAAPIGWFSQNQAEFAVAIRSALLKKQDIFVYAGAGIVKGSDPDKEWQEIEDKIHIFKQLIHRL